MLISNEYITQKFHIFDKYKENAGNYEFDRGKLREDTWEKLRKLAKNEKYIVSLNKFDNQLWYDTTESKKTY